MEFHNNGKYNKLKDKGGFSNRSFLNSKSMSFLMLLAVLLFLAPASFSLNFESNNFNSQLNNEMAGEKKFGNEKVFVSSDTMIDESVFLTSLQTPQNFEDSNDVSTYSSTQTSQIDSIEFVEFNNSLTYEEEGYAKAAAYIIVYVVGYSYMAERYGYYKAFKILAKSGLSKKKFFKELLKAEASYQGTKCVKEYLNKEFKEQLEKRGYEKYNRYVDRYVSGKCIV